MIVRTERGVFLPTLYSRTASGKVQRWRVWALAGAVYTQHGLVGGREQRTVGRAAQVTNAGRANERGAVAQACAEAESLWRNKLERKYRRTPEECETAARLPMLAKDFWYRPRGLAVRHSPAAKKLKYPVYVQRKLNGVRCLASWVPGRGVVLTSRQGKEWNIPHVAAALTSVLRGSSTVLDGELYRHGLSPQRITSLARDYREASRALQFHVYDLADGDDMAQSKRLLWLKLALSDLTDEQRRVLVLVETRRAKSADEVEALEREFVREGYEGAIVRSRSGRYRWAARSADLLKVKTFVDKEFLVVGVREGRGKHAGSAVIVCQNDLTTATFRAVPKASREERQRLWRRRAELPGLRYTVRFFDRTDEALPLFPVGVQFRDPRDQPTDLERFSARVREEAAASRARESSVGRVKTRKRGGQ